MTLFWIIAALLIVAALLFLLLPLLRHNTNSGVAAQRLNLAVYRDQQRELEADRHAGTLSEAQYERARQDLERRLLDDVAADQAPVIVVQPPRRLTAIVMGVAVPLLAVGLYFTVGNPHALAPVALPDAAREEVSAEQIQAMVAKLAERMKQNPDDPKGWAMLAKSYAVMGRFDDATAAYRKAVERVPDDADLLADFADTLAMAQGQDLRGEPEALVMRALKIDPAHIKSLALAGTIAFDKKDYAGALKYWEKLATLIPPDNDMARAIQSSINEARGLAGGGAKVAAVAAESSAKAADKPATPVSADGVSGTVTLAPALASKAAPNDIVFIFARPTQGPRMPLAILKKKVSELPITFKLDDSLAMSPAARLSGAPQVIIGARISKSGDAMPRSGDLQGVSTAVSNTAKNIAVVIDTEVQ